MPDGPLLDDGIRAFFDGPVSILVGTADQLRAPDVARGCGIAVLDDRTLRVLVPADAPEVRANAQPDRRCAVIVTDITTYRSLQWKGTVVRGCEPRTGGDLAMFHRHVETFAASAGLVGLSPSAASGLFPHDVAAIELTVDARFDQTPGPGAGRREG